MSSSVRETRAMIAVCHRDHVHVPSDQADRVTDQLTQMQKDAG